MSAHNARSRYCPVREKSDLTPDILEAAEGIVDGWYSDDSPIDWKDFLDRLDGTPLDNGSLLDLGDDITTPAILALKKHIRAYRKL